MFARRIFAVFLLAMCGLALACSRGEGRRARFERALAQESYKYATETIDLMTYRAPELTRFLLSPDSRVITPDSVIRTTPDSIAALYRTIVEHTPIVRIERALDSVAVDTARARVRTFGVYTLWLRMPGKAESEPRERGCYTSEWAWPDTSWVRTLDSLRFCPEGLPSTAVRSPTVDPSKTSIPKKPK
jgi:hypothetical protein